MAQLKDLIVNGAARVIGTTTSTSFVGPLTGNVTGNATTATKASQNSNGYSLADDIVKGLSMSGTTITYTKISGDTGTMTLSGVVTTTDDTPATVSSNIDATTLQGHASSYFISTAGGTITSSTASTSTTTGALIVTGGVGVGGNLYASKVYNSVWNDIADFVEVSENFSIEYGKAYTRDENGNIVLSKKDKPVLGIASDTYGLGIGNKEGKHQMPIAVGGWVLAYVDEKYPPMTPLKAGDNGILTKLLDTDRDYLCVGFFDRVESLDSWNGIQVNSRYWVKVK